MIKFNFLFTLLLLGYALTAQTALTPTEKTELIALYKHLHANPELSFHETETAAHLAKEMRDLGFTVTEQVGGTGIVAVFENGPGKTILVRTDLDALPLTEATGLPHASKVTAVDAEGKTVGVMHACGHDMHMTVWAGTARKLVAAKDQWSGTLVFIGQPAEERGAGARALLADGLYENYPRPDYALALHLNATLPSGTVGYRPGYAMANVDMVDITVSGKGGHGAYPHTTLDPVLLAARIVTDLQTIVSREISPLEAGVVTVGSIHGGAKGNVIPDQVKLELTLRSYTDENRNGIIEKVKRICRGTAISAGVTEEDMMPVVTVRDEHCPALYNNQELTERVADIFVNELGAENVREVPPVMGGEDFSEYGRTNPKVPIMLFWLGAVEPEKIDAAARGELRLPSLHNSAFAPDTEPTLETGVRAMSAAVLGLLKSAKF